MTLGALVKELSVQVGLKGRRSNYLMKKFINESILKLCRMTEWQKLIVIEDLVTDGSESYLLDSTHLTNNFETGICLMTDAGVEYEKYPYSQYLALTEKEYSYSIVGNTIYVSGTGTTLKLVFSSPGSFASYPMTDTTDEVPATIYYSDVIKQMTIIEIYRQMHDDTEILNREQSKLNDMLGLLRRKENRETQNGTTKFLYVP